MIPAICVQNRAFDQAAVVHHKLKGAGLIDHRLFSGGVELPPGRAACVQQGFPSGLGRDLLQPRGVYAVFFKVVEVDRNIARGKPGTGFFNRVAVGDAVEFHTY